ncbi:guanylate binding 5 isoform X1 [Pelobates cultripes]|uniref:Guanylate binding 5 isoform X1 n=1 Tax=Pelobates cultripes TaxID=61616 RepID=A0AAD1T471_PELCU|nr:guanylate binding 5 isoform X1 [Pelobates cultripes]
MALATPMQDPVCLIENNDQKKLVINDGAVQILMNITQPVVVVAIVGQYRTGKSYLMNNLAGRKKGFQLGASIQSKTKGIWMWCIPHPTKHGHTLVLLDTEGLGDVEKGDSENDAWIFCLAVLLSSNFVFNSVGTINQQAMEQLHYVTELTKRIRLNSSERRDEIESDDYRRVFPSFTWCVRDFCLQLERNGQKITEDEYLQNSLMLKPGLSEDVRQYNLPRECINEYFHSHKCFVFDRPTSTENLQHLEDLQDLDLNKVFVEQTRRFCNYTLTEGRVKTLAGGREINGRLLGNLAKTYVEAIHSGSIPCMESAVVVLAKMENDEALKDVVSTYRAMMKSNEESFPTETQDMLLDMHRICEQVALGVFLGSSFQDKDQKYIQELKRQLDDKFSEFSKCNENKSATRCKEVLKILWASTETDISRGIYMKPRGYLQFSENKMWLVNEYNKTPGKGMKALEVLQDFLNKIKDVEVGIMQADQTLTQKEKELQANKASEAALQREKEILDMKNKHTEQLLLAERRSYEQNKKMLLEKMEADKNRLREENKWLIEQKMKEIENVKNQEFQGKMYKLQRDIEQLKAKKTKDEEDGGWCVIA